MKDVVSSSSRRELIATSSAEKDNSLTSRNMVRCRSILRGGHSSGIATTVLLWRKRLTPNGTSRSPSTPIQIAELPHSTGFGKFGGLSLGVLVAVAALLQLASDNVRP